MVSGNRDPLATPANDRDFAKKFQIGGLSRDKLYPFVKSEGSRVVYLKVSKPQKEMPKKVHISLYGRSGASETANSIST